MDYFLNVLPKRNHLTRYPVAALSVIVALLLTLLLQPLLKSTVFSLFFAAVTFSAWYGGFASGLLATILSVLASDFFLKPVAENFAFRHGANLLHLVLFSIVALLISSLNAALRAARQRAETNLAKLQLSEERYRRIVDTAYEGIWLLNAQLSTEYVNHRLAEMLGYSVEAIGSSCLSSFMLEATGSEIKTIIQQWQQGVRERFDCCFRTQDGSQLWAIVSTTPILTSNGEFNGVLAMLTDISDRKQTETERTQLLEREQACRVEAEAANRCKDEFLAMLSHELRSPLNPILGWAEILQSQKLNQEKTDYALKSIKRNAKLQAKLIEDLLDISRILQGKLSMEVYAVNLITIIEAAIEIVSLAAEEKAINLKFCIVGLELPEEFYILGDSKRLHQIMCNLLTNAIKFTPKGGRVEIKMSLTSPSQNFATIQVKDTGVGIKPEFLPHVFESFRQADNSTTKNFGGLGLGLSIVRHLVELHGGTVEAYSLGEEQGATFTVKLPLLQNSDEAKVSKNLDTDSHLVSSSLILAGLKILVVDDEPDIRELLIFMLEQYGAIVRVAASAQQALQVLAHTEQDLLLSDVSMPNVDGYTLMRQIRDSKVGQKNRQIQAIALTGYTHDLDIQRAKLAGFQQILAKPLERAELVTTILNITGRSDK